MKKTPAEFCSPRRAAAVLVCLFVSLFSSASFAGSRVVDQSFINTAAMPTQVSLDPYYEWVDVPVNSNVNVALYFHNSSEPMPMTPKANVGPVMPLPGMSGFVDDSVVDNEPYDPVLSCTRFVMTVDGVVVAQDFKDHAGTYCRDHFTAFNTLPSIPKGRVIDQSFINAAATHVSMDPYYEWVDVPVGFTVNVALYFHNSTEPMPLAQVANVGPGNPIPASSGFVDDSVVNNVLYDPVLSCTRFVMTVNGLVVAQDFKDHAGTYCRDHFGVFDTLEPPLSVPVLDTVGIAMLTLTIATLGALVVRMGSGRVYSRR